MTRGADLVLFPELAVTGYPPEDLLLRPGFIRAARARVEELAREVTGSPRSSVLRTSTTTSTTRASSAPTARSSAVYRKRFLPNYGVFDEDRYFAPGRDHVLLRIGETLVGADGVRGHLAAGPAGDRHGARGRAADREHLGVAVPRRQGGRA